MARINPVLRINPRNAAAATGGITAVGVSGSNGSFSARTVTFGNSNGVSFYTSNGSLVASVAGGGGVADGFNNLVAGTQTGGSTGSIVFSNSNGITFGMSNSSIITASHNGLTTQLGQAVSAGNGSYTFQTLSIADSNGISFSTGTQGIYATVRTDYQSSGAYLTTAAQSNHSHNLATTTTNGSLVVVATTNSNGATFAVPPYITTGRASNDGIGLNTAKTNVTWTVNSNGLSLDGSGYAGTGTSATNASITLNSNGLAISVAAGGGGADGYNILAAGTQTAATTGSVLFQTGNGITFGMNNSSVITASHNGITTGRASNDGIGLNTALTAGPLAWTVNSGGLSLNAESAAGTTSGFGGNLISGSMTHNTAGLNLSLNHPAWLTTAMQSNAATLSNIRVSGGTTSNLLSALTFADSNGVSFGLNAGTMTATVKTDYLTSQSNQNVTAANGGFAFQTLSFSNVNGISFGTSAGSAITASHNGITTGRASTDAIGLNTAKTNVTWTVNSSGLSLDASGYAGTGTSKTGGAALTLNSNGLQFNGSALAGTNTTFNGANISGSMTVNTDGVNLSMSVAAPGGGATPAASASNGSFTFSTLGFSNANNVTFGTSAGSIITASVAAPGAAAENNWVNLLGANTAGNTTASGSTLGLSGINLTLSGTNNSAINISAPATSSIIGTNGISISTAGSTISVAREVQSRYWNVPGYNINSQTQQALASTYVVFPFSIGDNVSFDYLRLMNSVALASTSFASTANTTFSYNLNVTYNMVLYSQNTGASSLSLASISSKSVGLTQSANVAYGSASNTQQLNTYAVTYPISTGTSSFSSSYSTSNVSTIAVSTGNYTRFTGMKFLDIPFAGSLTPGVYWMALNASTTATTQATNLSGIRLVYSTVGVSQINNTIGLFGQANNASIQLMNGMGSFTTAGGVTTASLGFSNVSSSASHVVPMFSLSRTIN